MNQRALEAGARVRSDALSKWSGYFVEFIDQQLAKPDEPETDQPIVHADIGYGAE